MVLLLVWLPILLCSEMVIWMGVQCGCQHYSALQWYYGWVASVADNITLLYDGTMFWLLVWLPVLLCSEMVIWLGVQCGCQHYSALKWYYGWVSSPNALTTSVDLAIK